MQKRRFLANVICPQCRQIDKTVTFIEEAVKYIECIQCGMRLSQPQKEKHHFPPIGITPDDNHH